VRLAARVAARATALVCLAALMSAARAQDTDILAPEASNRKAREVIQQSIQAMGGAAYLGVKDATRKGRFSRIQHNGQVTGTIQIVDLLKMPNKERLEYIFRHFYETFLPIPIEAPFHKTGTAYEVHNGDQGWLLGGGGVEELPRDVLEQREEQRRTSFNVVFRERLDDPTLVLRYGGMDVLDLKTVDWIEISDGGRYTALLAIDRATHLPLRTVYRSRDPKTRDIIEEVEHYSNYHAFQGVVTPMQILRDRNGWQNSQLFLEDVKYNTGLSDELFTREGLEAMARGKGKKD